MEYAKDPSRTDLLTNRTNARYYGETIVRFDTMIRSRKLKSEDVIAINYLLKARARKFIAATTKEWLYPEATIQKSWAEIGKVLEPPKNELWHFGGDIYVGYKDGSTHYQNEFGSTVGDLSYLKKEPRNGKIEAHEPCVCGSGKKYEACCRDKDPADMPVTTVRSIRERNLMFFDIVVNILGLTKEKTWDDVRREISDNQVKDIHNAFGCLWPPETNVVDLLPRPDKKVFRALYSGLIDPRIIPRNVTSFSLYFDEIIVINPFMNPAHVKPEYNPIHSPSQYKQETLKNVFLLMWLIPFIEAGIVNLIPDPCAVNNLFRKQLWDMAQARSKNSKFHSEYFNTAKELSMDDCMQAFLRLPDENIKRRIKTVEPDLSNDKVEKAFNYIKQKCLENPLALLQPITPGEKGGQLSITHFSPNLELGFFLAQITGSFIYTDNQQRWEEIIGNMNCFGEPKESLWEPLVKCMGKLDYVFEIDPFVNLQIRQSGKMALIRNVLRKIFICVQTETDPLRIKTFAQNLADELKEAHEKSRAEWDSAMKEIKQQEPDIPLCNYNGKIDCVLPAYGFGINPVHRLLLSYGSINYLKSVPMAMFVEKEEKIPLIGS